MLHHHEGKIINISSIWGDAGASCEVLYSTTKGGINAFTKALAKEVAASNIQVNAIAFGMIDTEMNAEFDEEDLALIKEEIPADYKSYCRLSRKATPIWKNRKTNRNRTRTKIRKAI